MHAITSGDNHACQTSFRSGSLHLQLKDIAILHARLLPHLHLLPVQLRNTLMACTLFATASAYIGARALPTALLDEEWSETLFSLGVRLSWSF